MRAYLYTYHVYHLVMPTTKMSKEEADVDIKKDLKYNRALIVEKKKAFNFIALDVTKLFQYQHISDLFKFATAPYTTIVLVINLDNEFSDTLQHEPNVVQTSARHTKVYKICKFETAVLSAFYLAS